MELVVTMGSVIYDTQDRLFKMWYDAANYNWSKVFLCYATSRDGIHWDIPNLGLIEYQGSKNNNFVFTAGKEGEIAGGVFKDPVATDRERQYKMIYHLHNPTGIGVAFSIDGIHWKNATDKPVIPAANSPNSVLWDPRLSKYVAHTRNTAHYYHSDWNNRTDLLEELRPGPEDFFLRREILQSESDDFLKWESRGVIMSADTDDPPQDQQFYNMEWMPYGNVYFGFISVYHTLPSMKTKITPGVDWMDTVDVQLAFSRDGRSWNRAGGRDVFMPLGNRPGAFDHKMLFTMQHPIMVGDEIWIYYVGFSGRHGAPSRKELQGGAVGLARLRKDGFVSIDAGEGTLTTRLLKISGDRLVINADASLGSIKVEILDQDGEPLPGFGLKDARSVIGDQLRHLIQWSGGSDLGYLKGKKIAFKFHIDRSKLFSFQLE